VVFDAIAAARARGTDVVIADTAGRLPTQLHLMEEAKKIKRVIAKAETGAPHEVCSCWRPTPAELRQPDQGVRRGARSHRADSSPSSTAPPRAARCAPSPQRPLPLAIHGRPARAPTICARSLQANSSRRFSTDHGHHLVPPGQQALSGGFEALKGSQLHHRAREMLFLTGHSGAGKTTLLS